MSTYVGLLTCHGRIFESNSLKDKRRIVQSVLTKVRNRFNLSAAEVGLQDQWQSTELAFACVGSHRKTIEQELRRASELVEQTYEIEIVDAQITFV